MKFYLHLCINLWAAESRERQMQLPLQFAAINCALQSRQRKCRQRAHIHTNWWNSLKIEISHTHTKTYMRTYWQTNTHTHEWHTPACLLWRAFKPTQLRQFYERVTPTRPLQRPRPSATATNIFISFLQHGFFIQKYYLLTFGTRSETAQSRKYRIHWAYNIFTQFPKPCTHAYPKARVCVCARACAQIKQSKKLGKSLPILCYSLKFLHSFFRVSFLFFFLVRRRAWKNAYTPYANANKNGHSARLDSTCTPTHKHTHTHTQTCRGSYIS